MRRLLPLVIVLCFLFSSCATTPNEFEQEVGGKSTPSTTLIPSVAPTLPIEPIATSTSAPTSTPETTATAIASGIPAPSSTVEAKPSATAIIAESNGLKPKDVYLGDRNHWLEILGDIDSLTRGSVYGSMTVDYQGRKITYLVTSIIFHNNSGFPSSSETSGNIPANEFNPGTRAGWKDNQFDPSVVNDGSLAAWVKQQYGSPGDSVVIGLQPYGDQISNFNSTMKSWESEKRLDLISNNFFGGVAQNGPDPVVDSYFQAHPGITQRIVDFSTTANISDLDGAALELVIGVP